MLAPAVLLPVSQLRLVHIAVCLKLRREIDLSVDCRGRRGWEKRGYLLLLKRVGFHGVDIVAAGGTFFVYNGWNVLGLVYRCD